MTARHKKGALMRTAQVATVALLAAAGVAGCGGSSGSSTTKTNAATTATTSTTPKKAGKKASKQSKTLQVVVAVKGPNDQKFVPTTTAVPDKLLAVRAIVRKGQPQGKPMRVTVGAGPGKKLSVKAGGKGEKPSGSAKITASTKVKLEKPRYQCPKSGPTFCPVKVHQKGGDWLLDFDTPKSAVPISIIFFFPTFRG